MAYNRTRKKGRRNIKYKIYTQKGKHKCVCVKNTKFLL